KNARAAECFMMAECVAPIAATLIHWEVETERKAPPMSTPQEAEDAKVVKDLQALARHVDRQLPYGWGFVVLAFPFGAGSRMNYISNANRADIVRAMYEFIEATKGKWAEHQPELDSR